MTFLLSMAAAFVIYLILGLLTVLFTELESGDLFSSYGMLLLTGLSAGSALVASVNFGGDAPPDRGTESQVPARGLADRPACSFCNVEFSTADGMLMGSGEDVARIVNRRRTYCSRCRRALCQGCAFEASKERGLPFNCCPSCGDPVPDS